MKEHYDLQFRKYGRERTPGGTPRYCFWFGTDGNAFILYKFFSHKPITSTPPCVLMSFKMRDFITAANDVGLSITNGEKAQLAAELSTNSELEGQANK